MVTQLLVRIGKLRKDPAARLLIGIAGCPGAGKTTLTHLLLDALPEAGWVPMDGFHFSDAVLADKGLLERKGAPETFDTGGYFSALSRLKQGGEDVYVPSFDRDLEQPLAAGIKISSTCKTIISEGNYLLLPRPEWARVRELFDEVWFVDTPQELRISRLVNRHMRYGKTPQFAREWVQEVDQTNAALIEAATGRADLVIPFD
ncbi:nucleoside/nucleotide kinase family protein [Actinomyces sp. HMSC06A08]|nr:nucleoside/nucleotide kinase family protein [Actinomyces sp. HMSC064C12]OFK01536.1 nucleoside/nucleotide kinase family protein [Actinomyces sp. HMSC072A03]OFT55087.1 nucleoside/nucleotide kinase family protein [Actinomyces sp. HMSC06A08]